MDGWPHFMSLLTSLLVTEILQHGWIFRLQYTRAILLNIVCCKEFCVFEFQLLSKDAYKTDYTICNRTKQRVYFSLVFTALKV